MFAKLGFATFEADGKLKLTATVQLKIKVEVDQDKVTISGGGAVLVVNSPTNLQI